MRQFLVFFLLLFSLAAIGQPGSAGNIPVVIEQIPPGGILLDKGWKFLAGDNPKFANPTFDDTEWESINLTLDIYYQPQIRKAPVGWFRIKLHIDSSLLNKPLAFQVYQSIASEIYLDGKLLQRYGTVSHNRSEIKAFQPNNELVGLQFNKTEHTIAVRFSVQDNLPYFSYYLPFTIFNFRINTVSNATVAFKHFSIPGYRFLEVFEVGLFLVIALIHLGLFIKYKRQKANFYFSIAAFAYGGAHLLHLFTFFDHSIAFRAYGAVIQFALTYNVYGLFLFLAVWQLFLRKTNIYFWSVILYCALGVPITLTFYEWGWFWGFVVPQLVCMIAFLLVTYRAWRTEYKDVGILLAGISLYITSFAVFIFMYTGLLPNAILLGDFHWASFFYHFSVVCVPVSLSIYLAQEFAFTSKELERKLSEVQQLSEEKQQILISQKEMLEQQVTQRTEELKQSLEELKATQAQLIQQEKMASLGELTAGIAHEIQNPLNFMNNFSAVNKELLEELQLEVQNGNVQEVIALTSDIKANEEKIVHHGRRADSIVKGMLQHARTSSGQKEPADINQLVDEYLRLSYQRVRAKDKAFSAALHTNFDTSVGQVAVVPQDIGRVLLNLFNNAFYAVSEKKTKLNGTYEPKVSVSTRKEGNHILIQVRDNGTGMPPKVADKVFQPFFTTKPTGEGTGLGLSLSYDVVTKGHGGNLTVTSKEGEGSEFIIELPTA